MRYVLGTIAIIIIAFVAIILLIGRTPNSNDAQTGEQAINTSDYVEKDATFSFLNSGQINAMESHREIRISVSKNNRKAEVLAGYNGQVIKQQDLPNTTAAYEAFIRALEQAGFTNKPEKPASGTEVGVCPLGKRQVYEIFESGKSVLRLWSTTCGDKNDDFAGNESMVKTLFENQIPDYSTFVSDVQL